MFSEILLIAQLTTEDPAPKTPAYSWEQKQVYTPPPLYQRPTFNSMPSGPQKKNFEEELFESNR